MTTPLLIRRSVAVLASAGAAAALALIPASGAHAGVAANFEAIGQAGASFTGSGSGDCNLSSGDSSVTSNPVAFGRGSKSRSVNLSATFTNTLDSGDRVKVKGNIKSTLTLKRQGGGLKSLDLTANGAIRITHTTIGSHCTPTAVLLGEIPTATFTESKKGTLKVTYVGKPNSLVEFLVVNVKTGQSVLETVDVGTHTHGSASVSLKPGKYAIGESAAGMFSGAIFGKSASLSQKTSADVAVHAVFTPKKH
jgi:hypothetical protein